jgi:hypothetical protein
MRQYIVTQGLVEQAMMKRLVRDHPVLRRREIQVIARELGGASSAARTILAVDHDPVALIVDTNSIDRTAIAEQRGLTELHLGDGGLREEWEIIQGVPQVVALLFQDEDILSSLLPAPLSFEQRIVARYEPKRILTEAFTQAGKPFPEALIRKLRRTNLSALWKLEVLQPLERFLLGGSLPQQPDAPA